MNPKNPDLSALEIRRTEILQEMSAFKTMVEWAAFKGVTKQAIDAMLTNYCVKAEWKRHKRTVTGQHRLVLERPAVYCLYFNTTPHKKYYGSTTNLKSRISSHISQLRQNTHLCIDLQKDFDRYGEQDFVVKELCSYPIDRYLFEQKLISNNLGCYNKNATKGNGSSQTYSSQKPRLLRKNGSKPRHKSNYWGVVWVWRAQLWKAQPTINGKQVYIGYFKSEKLAHTAIVSYCKKAGVNVGIKNKRNNILNA